MGIVLAILCMSLFAAVGGFFLVLSCVLSQLQTPKGSCWVLFVIFFYVLVPIPVIFIKRITRILRSIKWDEELNAWATQHKSTWLKFSLISDIVLFFTTGIMISSFALPVILARANVIRWGAVGFVAAANIFIFGTMWAFFKRCKEKDRTAEHHVKWDFRSCKSADEVMISMIKQKAAN